MAMIASTTTVTLATAGPAHAEPGCQNGGAYVVFARGSGQSINASETNTFKNGVFAALPAAGISSYSWAELGDLDGNGVVNNPTLEYPASAVPWAFLDGYYNTSVFIGVRELITSLNYRYTLGPIGMGCVSETLILGGYSQGADLLGWALALTDPNVFGIPALTPQARSHIGFVALYGDPHFNVACYPAPNREWVRGGARCDSFPRLGARSPYVPSDLLSRTGSWCDDGDGLCAANQSTVGLGNHTTISGSKWIPDSAAEIAAAARVKQCSLVLNCSSGGTSAPPPPPPNYTNDRTVLHGSDGSLWVMAGGAKFYFGSMTEFTNLGYSTSNMAEVSTATLGTIPTVPRNGTVLRSGGGQIYIVAGGSKFYFGSMTEYYNQGYTDWARFNVPQGPLDQISDAPGHVPGNGTVVQRPDGALFVVAGGVRWHFGSMTEFSNLGYTNDRIIRVSGAPLDGISDASASNLPAAETVFRGTDSTLWVMKSGVRRSFTSMTQFASMGYTTSQIVRVPDAVLASIPSGGNLP